MFTLWLSTQKLPTSVSLCFLPTWFQWILVRDQHPAFPLPQLPKCRAQLSHAASTFSSLYILFSLAFLIAFFVCLLAPVSLYLILIQLTLHQVCIFEHIRVLVLLTWEILLQEAADLLQCELVTLRACCSAIVLLQNQGPSASLLCWTPYFQDLCYSLPWFTLILKEHILHYHSPFPLPKNRGDTSSETLHIGVFILSW